MATTAPDMGALSSERGRRGKVRRIAEARATQPRQAARELCHDLRGPAAAIVAIAAAATVESDVSPAVQARLTQIMDEARRISALCRDVLETSAPSSVVVAMDELATSITAPASITSDVSVELRLAPSSVVGNPHALGRALWNLLDNAMRAAGPGGAVRVDISEECGTVRVAVSDSGPGFGASESGFGGLGLRIARRVVAEHGGDLMVTQHGELGGASVVLLLPSADRYQVAQPS